jgi:hypothetical protein
VPVTVGHNPPVPAFFFSFTPNPFSKTKNPGINPGQLARKGRGKKKKKKKTLVLTMGRSGAYTANPPEKGVKNKNKKKPWC